MSQNCNFRLGFEVNLIVHWIKKFSLHKTKRGTIGKINSKMSRCRSTTLHFISHHYPNSQIRETLGCGQSKYHLGVYFANYIGGVHLLRYHYKSPRLTLLSSPSPSPVQSSPSRRTRVESMVPTSHHHHHHHRKLFKIF